MNSFARLSANLSQWSRSFASAIREVLTAFARAAGNRIVSTIAATSRLYSALEGAVVDSAVLLLELLIALRQALLIVAIPILLTWAAVHWHWRLLWSLPIGCWIVIAFGIADTPRRMRGDKHGRAISPSARELLTLSSRIALRAFFVAVTIVLSIPSTRARVAAIVGATVHDFSIGRADPTNGTSMIGGRSAPGTSIGYALGAAYPSATALVDDDFHVDRAMLVDPQLGQGTHDTQCTARIDAGLEIVNHDEQSDCSRAYGVDVPANSLVEASVNQLLPRADDPISESGHVSLAWDFVAKGGLQTVAIELDDKYQGVDIKATPSPFNGGPRLLFGAHLPRLINKRGGAPNRIGIEVRQRSLVFILNGHPIHTYAVEGITTGRVRLGVSSAPGNDAVGNNAWVSARFDYLRVTQLR